MRKILIIIIVYSPTPGQPRTREMYIGQIIIILYKRQRIGVARLDEQSKGLESVICRRFKPNRVFI